MRKIVCVIILILFQAHALNCQFDILENEKEIWDLKIKIIKEKLDKFLLPAMKENNMDMWIIYSRENNIDPILSDVGFGDLGNGTYIFIDDGSGRIKKIAMGRAMWHIIQAGIYDQVIPRRGKPTLREIVEKYDPNRIGINISRSIPMCDGLTSEMKKRLEESLGEKYAKRLVSAEKVMVYFRAHRIKEEVELMRTSFRIAKRIHHDVLSEEYIKPGITTAEDIYWAYRQKIREYKVQPGWPTPCPFGIFVRGKGTDVPSEVVVEPGDFIDVNFGVNYLGMCSDINRQAYVLKPGETEPPEGIRKIFNFSLEAQEYLKNNMISGRTGNEVHDSALKFITDNGYEGNIWSHSIGNTVHGIGPSMSRGYKGQLKLEPVMLFAVELGVRKHIDDVGKVISITRQDDAVLTERGMEYLSEPQKKLILIKTGK